jgi:anti-anti-sigma factor
MELSKYLRDGVTVIGLDGDLDSGTAPRTQGGLEELLPDNGTAVLDLSGMSYMSSAGLRVLLLAHRQAKRTGVSLMLAGIPDGVRQTMSATGFLEFFVCLDSVDAVADAVEARQT